MGLADLLVVTAALGFIRWRVFTFQIASSSPRPLLPWLRQPINRRTGGLARKLTVADRIPRALFRLPLVASWIRFGWRHRSLTLPTAVNPRMPAAGLCGGSTSDTLLDIAASERGWIADFVVMRRSAGAAHALRRSRKCAAIAGHDAGLTFPLVAKPDIGWRGLGVRRIDDVSALREYLRHVPPGEKLILQRLVSHPGVASALYARLPGASSGRVLSL